MVFESANDNDTQHRLGDGTRLLLISPPSEMRQGENILVPLFRLGPSPFPLFVKRSVLM